MKNWIWKGKFSPLFNMFLTKTFISLQKKNLSTGGGICLKKNLSLNSIYLCVLDTEDPLECCKLETGDPTELGRLLGRRKRNSWWAGDFISAEQFAIIEIAVTRGRNLWVYKK